MEFEMRPPRLVLGALILVAAVANLNLSVANVALPRSARRSTRHRPRLNLIAVGYSLGLAASVLYLGAVGDHLGESSSWGSGMAPRSPCACSRRGLGPITVLFVARLLRRPVGRHGVPHDPRPDHRPLVGPGAPARSPCGWRSAAPSPPSARSPRESLLPVLLVGLVFLDQRRPSHCSRSVMAVRLVPAHVTETMNPVDNLGGILSVVLVACSDLGDQLRSHPERDVALLALVILRGGRVAFAGSASGEPATLCTT